ncbi:MAG: lipopolysaccharide heptosyltransferase II [Bryobacteraceae bacterium]
MYGKILIRATNWVGDAVMSLPALQAVRSRFPDAHIAVLARPWVADLYARETCVDRVIRYEPRAGFRDLRLKWRTARILSRERFDVAILFQNAFEAAAIARLAGIPRRIGYDRDARGWLLTDAIPVPAKGEIPRHERFYYLELLRSAGLIGDIPAADCIRLQGAEEARRAGEALFGKRSIPLPVIGVSPGAAYGAAKQWLPERFAEAAATMAAGHRASVVVFGSGGERALCETVRSQIEARGAQAWNLAGNTGLREFIDLAAACRLYLTNDSGAMHIASALGVPTVAIFGATDDTATGPTGPLARVVREPVECSPCLLRECPIDHRCMTGVSSKRVAEEATALWKRAV